MESFQDKVKRMVAEGKVRVSEHGYDELTEDALSVRDIVSSVASGTLIEEYPDFAKGP